MGGARSKGNLPCFCNLKVTCCRIYTGIPPFPKEITDGPLSYQACPPVRGHSCPPVSRLDVWILVWLCIYAVYSVYVVAI